jgi:hypothetical protein
MTLAGPAVASLSVAAAAAAAFTRSIDGIR